MYRLLACLGSGCLWAALVLAPGCGAGDADDDDDDTGPPADDDVADDDDDNDDDNDNDDNNNDDTGPDYPNDGVLRINHAQSLGTHNSYHIEPPFLIVPSYNYTHRPLDKQLDLGVRQFELDLHWLPGEGLRVFHAPVIDAVSTCDTLVDCLTLLKDWSDMHPGHQPLLVMLEPKDDLNVSEIAEHALDIEADILAAWPRDRIVTPDDVRGDYATLRDAILDAGWPTLGAARNRILFLAHSLSELLANYHELYPGLEGAVMFTDSTPDDPFAAIMPMNDPIGGGEAIQAAVTQGFLVRTMAGNCCEEPEANDYTRFEAALTVGAHFISTDFPAPTDEYNYFLEIPGGNPSRCNPLTAPGFCTPADIENLPGS